MLKSKKAQKELADNQHRATQMPGSIIIEKTGGR